MTNFSVPAEGLPLAHTSSSSNDSPTIIRIDLNERLNRDLLRSVKSNDSVRIRLGRKPGLTIGTKHVSLLPSTSKFPQEIFSGSMEGDEPIHFSGKLSLSLETQHAREATAAADHALAALKNTYKTAQEERAATEPAIISKRLLKPPHRPSPLSGGLLGSRPSSPFLASGMSPRPGLGPTSAPALPGPSIKEKIKLDAIKTVLIHHLAIGPQDPRLLAEKFRVKRADLDKVLDKVARTVDGKKELKDRSFKDLDVWKFPYQSQNDRQTAIDRAISAYDRQRIEKSDNLWQMLLAKEDRNKGINLSRLNFDKPLATGNLTPKIQERSTDGGSTEGRSMASDQSNKKGKAMVSNPNDSQIKSKVSGDSKSKTSVPKDPLKLIAAASKEAKKSQSSPQTQPARQGTKYKSSERIVNSDEEADTVLSLPASKTDSDLRRPVKEVATARPGSSDNKSALSKPATSSKTSAHTLPPRPQPTSHTGGPDRGRLTPSTMAKTRSGIDTAKSNNGSRPRNGSSPAKPSPLGSSPPNNVRDADSASNSSKGTSHSSAPSSPPSSEELNQSKIRYYSPVVSEKKLEKSIAGLKRKAEIVDDPAPKRQQTKREEVNLKERFNSVPKTLAGEINGRSAGSSYLDSDTSSNSDRVVTKQQVIEEAKRFQKYWDKYRELHDRLSKETSLDRDEKELDSLWKMHTRLKGMKEQIWKDWATIEKKEAKKLI